MLAKMDLQERLQQGWQVCIRRGWQGARKDPLIVIILDGEAGSNSRWKVKVKLKVKSKLKVESEIETQGGK